MELIRSGSSCRTKCRPVSMRGTQTPSPGGGGAFAVRGGEGGALVSGKMEEGVEEEVSDAFPLGSCLDEGGRPDALGGAQGAEAQHPLVSKAPEVLS